MTQVPAGHQESGDRMGGWEKSKQTVIISSSLNIYLPLETKWIEWTNYTGKILPLIMWDFYSLKHLIKNNHGVNMEKRAGGIFIITLNVMPIREGKTKTSLRRYQRFTLLIIKEWFHSRYKLAFNHCS